MSTLRPLLSALALGAGLASATGAQEAAAVYEVTFDATWSSVTHPSAYPSSAHFSGLIGGTHEAGFSMWAPGALASAGIESMAETGATGTLRNEVQAAIDAGLAGEIVSGPSVAISPGVAVTSFTVTDEFPLVSLTTMIAPSPDWFVGVHDLDLFVGGTWADEVVVSLLAYDSGTDSGVTFTSSNSDTNPAEPIALQTGGPFFGTTPLGTFTFRRLSSVAPIGSGLNPADSLGTGGATPTIGQSLTFTLDDPSGSMATPASTVLAVGVTGLPTGLVLPNFGLAAPGASGELLVGSFEVLQAGPAYLGAPAGSAVAVPNDLNLVGLTVFSQGLFLSGGRLGLTNGLELQIG